MKRRLPPTKQSHGPEKKRKGVMQLDDQFVKDHILGNANYEMENSKDLKLIAQLEKKLGIKKKNKEKKEKKQEEEEEEEEEDGWNDLFQDDEQEEEEETMSEEVFSSEDEQDTQQSKTHSFRYLMNQLFDKNLKSCLQDLEKRTNVNWKSLVHVIIHELLCNSYHIELHPTLQCVYSAFCHCIHSYIDNSFGVLLLKELMKQFDSTDRISLLNMIQFVSYLYNFQMISFSIIYEHVIRKFDISNNPIHLELFIKCIKMCGNTLRSEDTQVLKQIILECNTKQSIHKGRFAYLKQVLQELKLNTQEIKDEYFLQVLQTVKSFKKEFVFFNEKITSLEEVKETKHEKHDSIAVKMGFVLPIEKSIFSMITLPMDDLLFELSKLMQKNVQQSIFKVLIQCACFEKPYNPFYATVMEKMLVLYKSCHNHFIKVIHWKMEQSKKKEALITLLCYLLFQKQCISVNMIPKLFLNHMEYLKECIDKVKEEEFLQFINTIQNLSFLKQVYKLTRNKILKHRIQLLEEVEMLKEAEQRDYEEDENDL